MTVTLQHLQKGFQHEVSFLRGECEKKKFPLLVDLRVTHKVFSPPSLPSNTIGITIFLVNMIQSVSNVNMNQNDFIKFVKVIYEDSIITRIGAYYLLSRSSSYLVCKTRELSYLQFSSVYVCVSVCVLFIVLYVAYIVLYCIALYCTVGFVFFKELI